MSEGTSTPFPEPTPENRSQNVEPSSAATTAEASKGSETGSKPRWQPLSVIDRRVAGVLVEKAKTTPDAYPLTLNAICTACNQKNNRAPVMQLEPDQVEESLERLRGLGAVAMVEGAGRVQRYRHYLYEWLGVDKVGLAVMAELLLRGDQTEGELRGRAARMEPIRDLAELRPVLDTLLAKGLVISLSSEGRGHVVSHALYQPPELERLRQRHAAGAAAPRQSETAEPAAVGRDSAPSAHAELEELRAQIQQLRQEQETMAAAVRTLEEEVGRMRRDLGG